MEFARSRDRDAGSAEEYAAWERDGKRCVRCNRDLPNFGDCRIDQVETVEGCGLGAFCVACYILRGDAKRWRTANIGAMVAAGILPKNWRDLVWFDPEIQPG